MIKAYDFGTTAQGTRATRFRLTNARGAYADILDFGCTVQALFVQEKSGALRDVVTGFPTLAGYENSASYMGAICGRVANRIAGARFTLAGCEHALIDNNNGNCLHGGGRAFSFSVWDAEVDGDSLRLSRTSPDGEYGFPGTLKAEITYRFTDDCALEMSYRATTDAPTLYNPTNHCYFVLDDEADVNGIRLWVDAKEYLETDADLIPTGKILPVRGTPLDFTQEKPIGRDIGGTPMGYDHCFLLEGEGLRTVARAQSPVTGVTLEVITDRPAIQLYTGNFLNETGGKNGRAYPARSAFCLETQTCPDAVHQAHFPSAALDPGREFASFTAYVLK